MTPLRVLIVSENISMKMGGESSLPFYYAKLFHERGAEVWLACHERVEAEVRESFPELGERIRFVKDTTPQKMAFQYSSRLPFRVRELLVGQAIHFSTQARIRHVARELADQGKIDVVLEPAPITPKGLSFMYRIGVPVVIGPMCGGMNFPPAFAHLDGAMTRRSIRLARYASELINRLVPGKLEAEMLLVANRGTEQALPRGVRGRVVRLFESGVDLEIWKPAQASEQGARRNDIRFVFTGRFVDWKGVQFLVPALAKAVARHPGCSLDLVGGGELDAEIRATIDREGLAGVVRMHGWLSRPDAARIVREADVFVMPSLRECGGTAILEAMALGKPVITTNWGGPADYVDASCGLLVDPSSPEAFIDGMADAMVRLASSPELRRELGDGGLRRVRRDHLAWDAKAVRVLELLDEVVRAPRDRARRVDIDVHAD